MLRKGNFFEKTSKNFEKGVDKGENICYNKQAFKRAHKKTTKSAAMAQLVEHILGKDEVISSNLISSSNPTDSVGFLVCVGEFRS